MKFNISLPKLLNSGTRIKIAKFLLTHEDSRTWPGLQWADLFAWGIRQKYEHKNMTWFDFFKDKVRYDEQYL